MSELDIGEPDGAVTEAVDTTEAAAGTKDATDATQLAAAASYAPTVEDLAQVQLANYRYDSRLIAVVYFLFTLLIPLVNVPRPFDTRLVLGLLTIVTTVVFMYLQLILARGIVRTGQSLGAAIAKTALFAVLWAATLIWFTPIGVLGHHLPFHKLLGHQVGYYFILVRQSLMGLLLTLSLTNLGTVISRIIREPNVLLPVALVPMPVDYLGAMAPRGFTHDMMAHAPDVVQTVSVSIPMVHGVNVYPLMGPGDVLFVAFFLMAVQTLRMNEEGTFKWMYGLLTATMLLITFVPFRLEIAALIPMGIAVLAANWKYFKLQRSEVFAMLYAIAIVLVVVVAFYLTSHKYLFSGKH